MKSFISILIAIATTCIGCSRIGSTSNSEKYQTEMTINKTRADIEEIKHDLHTQKIELSILEERVAKEENSLSSLKKDTFEEHELKLNNFAKQIANIENKISSTDELLSNICVELNKFSKISTDIQKALVQSKDKINEIEKNIALQINHIDQIARIKKATEITILDEKNN